MDGCMENLARYVDRQIDRRKEGDRKKLLPACIVSPTLLSSYPMAEIRDGRDGMG